MKETGIDLPSRPFLPGAGLTGLILIIVLAIGIVASSASADSTAVGEDAMVYLPAVAHGYYDGAILDGITGRVFIKGKPAADLPLSLRHLDIFGKWTKVSTTVADSEGYYQFNDIDSLEQNETYYVRYGANEKFPEYVFNWFGPLINEYTVGDTVYGGSFDVDNIPLISPGSGVTAALPVMLQWEKRGLPGDTYRIVIIDLDEGIYWRSIDLGDVDSYLLKVLHPDILYRKQYAWYVEVYMGPGNFGESFGLNDIIFLPGDPQQNAGTQSESPFERGSGRGGR